MKNINNILVFENDSEHIGKNNRIKELDNQSLPVEMWWDFSMSFYWDRESAFKRLSEIPQNTLVVTNPSFVGADNQFSSYITLFLKMKESGIKLNISIIYHQDFFMYLIKYLYNEQSLLKKQNNHRMLKEILYFHNIYMCDKYRIEYVLSESKLINFDDLMVYYIETHRSIEKTKVKINETGEIYPIFHVNAFGEELDDINYEVLVSETPFKSLNLKFNEFIKL